MVRAHSPPLPKNWGHANDGDPCSIVLCSAPTACVGLRTLRRYTGEKMRTRNEVAIADGALKERLGISFLRAPLGETA